METLVGKTEYLDYAAQLIREGGLVAFPTETVYGLGADAFNANAVADIFIAKGRPQDNPLIVHVASPEQAKRVACRIPEIAYTLWEAFSPGPLTLVLPKVPELPLVTTAGLQTVGIRIPNNPIALELIRRSDTPIAAPSANSSGRISPTKAEYVYTDMCGKIPLILDGGDSEIGIESTVLDLTKEVPVVLRPGAITVEMLSVYLDRVVNHKGEVIIAEAPGMKYKHYAPVVPCVAAKTTASAAKLYDSNPGAVILGRASFLTELGARAQVCLGNSPAECMRTAFSALREAEKKYSYIIIEDFEGKEGYYALNNRLKKSTGGISF